MKITFLLLSLLIISCSTKEKKQENNEKTEAVSEKVALKSEKIDRSELSFEETQKSLRKQLLNAKPNENLKFSMLQELYIRGLVNQVNDKIKFELPFNLHGFDCGAPDCYSTDITFEIPTRKPIEFPKTVDFNLVEHGCGMEMEIAKDGIFKLVELAPEYVNYYSEKYGSNLVILGEKRKLYYFPDTKRNSIKANSIDKILEAYDDEDENAIVPYQSTVMTTNEYENFIEKEFNDSEIYFASKRIHESFSENDETTIAYIAKFLERDSIKVVITHSIEEDTEAFYLKGKDKLDFFYRPEVYTGEKTRRKSDYFNVKENCYEFNIEGISHNSIYIKKLCYVNDEKQMSLSEIYLLDGD